MVVAMYSVRIGIRKLRSDEGSGIMAYVCKESQTERGRIEKRSLRVSSGRGSAYLPASLADFWMTGYERVWSSSGKEVNISSAMYYLIFLVAALDVFFHNPYFGKLRQIRSLFFIFV